MTILGDPGPTQHCVHIWSEHNKLKNTVSLCFPQNWVLVWPSH
jgi:hypothetical protein